MTTWPRETVDKVSRVYSEVTVDASAYVRRGADVGVVLKENLAKGFIKRCTDECDVKVHAEDLVIFAERDLQRPWLTVVRIHWAPSTKDVELRGGHPKDGLVLAYQGAPHEMLITEQTGQRTEDGRDVVRMIEHQWSMSGWSEDQRRWVYGLARPASREE